MSFFYAHGRADFSAKLQTALKECSESEYWLIPETHIRFMAQVSRDAAVKQKKQIIGELRSLAQYPQRFPFFEENYITPNKYHKMYIEKTYMVLYQIQDDTVYVDYIIDCPTDYVWLIH